MNLDCKPTMTEAEDLPGPDDYALPIEQYLDRNFGAGSWVRDPYDDKFVVWNAEHSGSGLGYIVIDRDFRRHFATIPASRVN